MLKVAQLCLEQGSQKHRNFIQLSGPGNVGALRGHEYSEELWYVMLEEMKNPSFLRIRYLGNLW